MSAGRISLGRCRKNEQSNSLKAGLPFSFARLCAAAVLGVCVLNFTPEARAQELKKVTFLPQWVAQAQFAGFYVAKDKGFYAKYGLDVELLSGGPEISPVKMLQDGKATFANLGLNTAIQEFSRSVDLVNIGQIVQSSALMFVAKKSSGIKEIKDINNKKVGVWTGISSVQSLSFLKKHNLDVKIVPQPYSLSLFINGAVDVASAMWYNEYHMLFEAGLEPEELTTFFFSNDPGLNFPEDGIYTLNRTFDQDPRICCNFVRATVEGWQYAFAHPDEALNIVMEYMRRAHVPASRAHQKWMLEAMKSVIPMDSAGNISAELSRSGYERVGESLREFGMIKDVPDFESFRKDCGKVK